LILLVIKFETIKSYTDKLHMYLSQQEEGRKNKKKERYGNRREKSERK
jgi:hypothetical protein